METKGAALMSGRVALAGVIASNFKSRTVMGRRLLVVQTARGREGRGTPLLSRVNILCFV